MPHTYLIVSTVTNIDRKMNAPFDNKNAKQFAWRLTSSLFSCFRLDAPALDEFDDNQDNVAD
ncbi:hypothetical protein LPL03_06080 [Lactiplantibacillus argentoratensis]|nr:hypothetical protein LJA01_07910 [Lactobacillus japonicus]GEO52512.1 hypothetical protein LPL03_06080 [Lactiplantibacillus argentoratensis]